MSIFLGDTAPSKIFVGDTEVSKVFVGDTQVRPSGWKPGANTVAYYPLKTDANDYSGNGNNLTNSGVVFGSYGGIDCANTAGGYLTGTVNNIPIGASPRTISFFANLQTIGTVWKVVFTYGTTSQYRYLEFYWATNNGGSPVVSHYYGDVNTTYSRGSNYRVYMTYVYDGTTAKIYANGTLVGSTTVALNTASSAFNISSSGNGAFPGYLSEFIIEDKARSETEITQYLNSMKDIYGIS